ncbi:hypothetical protein M2263_000996 [Providencia alcalifaciens]|nr:hypothetical protein [Providencia alcalifaciens]
MNNENSGLFLAKFDDTDDIILWPGLPTLYNKGHPDEI